MAYLYAGGYELALEWLEGHAMECYGDKELKGKFETQATKAERNPERYQDRPVTTGNHEPASPGQFGGKQ
jgi:hypothetical protein